MAGKGGAEGEGGGGSAPPPMPSFANMAGNVAAAIAADKPDYLGLPQPGLAFCCG